MPSFRSIILWIGRNSKREILENPESEIQRPKEARRSKSEEPHRLRSCSDFGRRLQKSHRSGVRTIRSPSPLPSPSGRGSIIGGAFDNGRRLELFQRGPWVSLSLRERVGVRGNGPWKLQTDGVLQLALGFREGHSSLRAAAMGIRIARIAGKRPPSKPMEHAQTMP